MAFLFFCSCPKFVFFLRLYSVCVCVWFRDEKSILFAIRPDFALKLMMYNLTFTVCMLIHIEKNIELRLIILHCTVSGCDRDGMQMNFNPDHQERRRKWAVWWRWLREKDRKQSRWKTCIVLIGNWSVYVQFERFQWFNSFFVVFFQSLYLSVFVLYVLAICSFGAMPTNFHNWQ